jgi:murein DD-endopeptidase MepM/ murein hydrolase activator NlpD
MGYALPTPTDWVTCSWQCHRDRNPPSEEAGTDFGSGYGSDVYAAEAGTITYVKHSNSGAMGRVVEYALDDGRHTRTLHMSQVWVGVGQRVGRGQVLGLSGASGYGDDWYYGPHAHQTLWPGAAWCCDTIDFALYVGSGQVAPDQRVVGAGGANGRTDPSTQNAAAQYLEPGVVANMNGWINGENVSGNPVWFRGALSGNWFWSGGFTDTGTHDLEDLNVAALGPMQRKATADVNGRAQPNTQAEILSNLTAGTVGDFDGWIYGESVAGENRWLRGAHSGAWFSLTYLEPHTTDNLADLNAPTTSADRVAGPNSVNVRTGPYTSFPVSSSIGAGQTVTMDGWTHGENVQGSDVWYRLSPDAGWAWAGGFTTSDTAGLTELVDVPVPTPPYLFDAFDPVVTEVKPAAVGNFEDGAGGERFPAEQTDVVLHDFGTDGQDTYQGTVSWFQNPASFTSAHFVVSGGHITQMVSLADRAFHAGADGNWFVGIEIDPVVGQSDGTPNKAETLASANLLLAALRRHYSREELTYHRHSEFMQTSCGDDIHFEDYPQQDEPACPDCPDCPDPDPCNDPNNRVIPVNTLVVWRDSNSDTADEIDAVIESGGSGRAGR